MIYKNQILELFEQHGELSVKEITNKVDASRQMVHHAIKQLLEEGKVEKFGRPPKTIYKLKTTHLKKPDKVTISETDAKFLKNHFLLITEIGEMKAGLEGFSYWCSQRNLPVLKTMDEYIFTRKKYLKYFSSKEVIDGTDKLLNTEGFEKIWLQNVYYLDFYAIERFGKTRLGVLLHYAKQGQNKFLMKIIVDEIKERVHSFIDNYGIDAVGFVLPTIRREVQIMKFLREQLQISLPTISLHKTSGLIPVPQKSLSKINERIRNAENTFAVTEQRRFNHVLLLDDAMGSGATMNQIAKKINNKQVANKVTGLAIVGSFKGFDVITDV
ncbi:Winged helix-turn-helix DNA-binding [Ekhidna lutea]|uniref:Winged helix-turn-helix DNA-binding n=1 Tax=Ekhidna lutea TaxID=447679 RepID=A0A239KLT9_EKHLU|nr:winged helix-turn-helix transcriptional regulator [Ekhidna lutea]SNT19111.1 Winged helix-turn-helix DNA-binding [Ekhidna lutea]